MFKFCCHVVPWKFCLNTGSESIVCSITLYNALNLFSTTKTEYALLQSDHSYKSAISLSYFPLNGKYEVNHLSMHSMCEESSQ